MRSINPLSAAFLVIVLFTLGCVDSSSAGTLKQGNGIVFNSFAFAPDKLKDNQISVLSLSFQNIGETKTGEVYVYLFGLSNDWNITANPNVASATTPTIISKQKMKLNSMNAPDMDAKTPGEAVFISWPLRAPKDLPNSISFDYNAMARVCYEYNTTANAKVEVYSEEEYISKQIDTKIKQHPIVLTQTRAPIQIEIDSMQPVVYTNEIIFKIRMSNSGGGTIISNNCKDIDNVTIDNDLFKSLQSFDLKISGIVCTPSVDAKEVYFFKDKSGKMTASFSMVCPVSGSNTPYQTSDLLLNFKYNYYIDTKAVASVEGTKNY